MADSALVVAQCSHSVLDVGSPGLRQLANAAEQGQWASSSNPLRLLLDQSQSGDRVWALTALLSVSPGTVQYTNNHYAVCFTLLCTQRVCYPPTLVDFLWGICPEQC